MILWRWRLIRVPSFVPSSQVSTWQTGYYCIGFIRRGNKQPAPVYSRGWPLLACRHGPETETPRLTLWGGIAWRIIYLICLAKDNVTVQRLAAFCTLDIHGNCQP
jgi:hypothetical protein